MKPEPRRKISVEYLQGYSDLAKLGHDRGRLEDLLPDVADLFEKMERLRDVDVKCLEMALNFTV